MSSPPYSLDKENVELSQGIIEQTIEGVEMTKLPIMISRCRTMHTLNPWSGLNEFRVHIPNPNAVHQRATGRYQIGETGGIRKIFVTRHRRWPIVVRFRPSVTPVEFHLRISPHYSDEDRAADPVERCPKHTSSSELKDLTVIEIVNSMTEYNRSGSLLGLPTTQITAVLPLDVVGLLHCSKMEHRSPEHCQPSVSQPILLPEVKCELLCRMNCYNSCLGLNSRGELDLLITLEARTDYDAAFEILGLEKIRIRCCACPSRDAREIASVDVASVTPPQPPRHSEPMRRSESILQHRKPKTRKLSLGIQPMKNLRSSHRKARDSSPPKVTINGRSYHILLVENTALWEQFRFSRNCKFLSDNPDPMNGNQMLQRIGKNFDAMEQCVREQLPSEELVCSSSKSSQSDQYEQAPTTTNNNTL